MQDHLETILMAIMALPVTAVWVVALFFNFHYTSPFAKIAAQAIMRLL